MTRRPLGPWRTLVNTNLIRFAIGAGLLVSEAAMAQPSGNGQRGFLPAPPRWEVPATEGFEPSESAGVFIGVRLFSDGRFAEVPYAADDAVDLAYLFSVELGLIRPANVVLSLSGEPRKEDSLRRLGHLLSEGAIRREATQSDIYDLIDKHGRTSGRRGIYVVVLATHGFTGTSGDVLLGSDSLGQRLSRTGIAASEILDSVAQSVASRRLVLIDACRERMAATHSAAPGNSFAMSSAFAEAISDASGQAALFATTRDGYAYDDFDRGNGVFASFVMDGLRGAASLAGQSFITVEALAAYVHRQVIEWVRVHRPEHIRSSRGISWDIDGSIVGMPLAVNQVALQNLEEYRRRLEAALDLLLRNMRQLSDPDNPVTGNIYDKVHSVMAPEYPGPGAWELLAELEKLDGDVMSQRNLVYFVETHYERLLQESGTTGWHSQTMAPRRQPARPHSPPPQRPTSSENETEIHLPERGDVTLPVRPEREPRLGDRWPDPVVDIDFMYVAPGSFLMGSPEQEDRRGEDEDQHTVTLTRGFWISRTEVTQDQFGRFIHETGYETQAEKDGWSWVWEDGTWRRRFGTTWRDSGGADHPVAHVSWDDARAFAEWLSERTGKSVRLPTEAEWEYAARARTTTSSYAGDLSLEGSCVAPELDGIAWHCGNSGMETQPVAGKDPNFWDLHDMLGNVSEWVADGYGEYPEGLVTNPPSAEHGNLRVHRGGSVYFAAETCRAADRGKLGADVSYSFLGFRLAISSYR